MFRIIGIIVVVAALVIGYTSLQKWYEGKATPAETVVNLRDQFSTAIKSKSDEKASSVNTSQDETHGKAEEQDETHGKAEEKESDSSAFSTEKAARELIKHSNE